MMMMMMMMMIILNNNKDSVFKIVSLENNVCIKSELLQVFG